MFAALLDERRGGRFALTPSAPFTARRRYEPDTAVLVTTFETATGAARVWDLMPVASEADKSRTLWPEHELLRVVEGVAGEVSFTLAYEPRPDYARTTPRLRDRGRLGIALEHHGGDVLVLQADGPLSLSRDRASVHGTVTVRAGGRRYLSLAFEEREPAVLPPLGGAADGRLAGTLAWWRAWSARCRYDGPWTDAVRRSALTLKLLTFAPSGAVVAAPTTSLPERLGGVRNWDYRYCWVRDASLTLQALFDLGYEAEGEAFVAWLLHTTRMTLPELRILYDVYGEPRLPERELPQLSGFADSRPVRVGNDASRQLQLDIYGEVLDAVYEFVARGGRLDPLTARMLEGFGRTVCRRWREPDESIWEPRNGPRHHTYSKAMCWVAIDRLLRLHEGGHLDVDRAALFRERDAIRETVEGEGFNPALNSYVSVLGGDDVDASLLLLARYGYLEAGTPRMRGTAARIDQRLRRNGLLYRYRSDDGLPPGEGAFGICGFWGVDLRARQGDLDGAAADFERLLGFANDVGLFAEEVDPDTGDQLGNFPQAFTHLGVIDAALTLEHCGGGRRRPGRTAAAAAVRR